MHGLWLFSLRSCRQYVWKIRLWKRFRQTSFQSSISFRFAISVKSKLNIIALPLLFLANRIASFIFHFLVTPFLNRTSEQCLKTILFSFLLRLCFPFAALWFLLNEMWKIRFPTCVVTFHQSGWRSQITDMCCHYFVCYMNAMLFKPRCHRDRSVRHSFDYIRMQWFSFPWSACATQKQLYVRNVPHSADSSLQNRYCFAWNARIFY